MRRGFAILIATASLLAGCSRAPARPAVPAATANREVVTLTVGYQGRIENALDILIRAFQEQNPGYRVETRQLPADYQAMIKAVAGGDLDLVAGTWDPDQAGRLVALDPYVARDRINLEAYGEVSSAGDVDGHIYGLQVLRRPLVIVADRERLLGAGLREPERCWTWDEFRAAARALTDPLGRQKVWGFQFALPFLLTDLWVTDQFGRPYWQAPATEAYAPYRFFMTMAQTDGSLSPQLIPTSGSLANELMGIDDQPAGLRLLQGGTAAMTEEYWRPDLAQQAALLPTPCLNPAKPLMSAVDQRFGIAGSSRRPDDAWRFLSFAAGPEGAELLARSGVLPAYMSEAVAAAWSAQQPAPPKVTQLFFRSRWLTEPENGAAPVVRGKVMQLYTWALKDGRPSEDAYAQYLKLGPT